MGGISCSRNTSFAFFLLTLIMFIVAFSTPFWYAINIDDNTIVWGLWQVCYDILNENGCGQIDNDRKSSEMKAIQGMLCIAMILYVASLVAYSVWMCKRPAYLRRHGVGGLGITALVLALAGGISNMIGVAIFAAYYRDELFGDRWEEIGDLFYHGSFIGASLAAVTHVINSVITLTVMMCCYRGQDAPADSGVRLEPSVNTGITVAVISDDPARIQPYPVQGYLPQSDLDKPGPYYPDPALSATAPIYPKPDPYNTESYNPNFYPPSGALQPPPVASYPQPGGAHHNMAVPNMYTDPPPPYQGERM